MASQALDGEKGGCQPPPPYNPQAQPPQPHVAWQQGPPPPGYPAVQGQPLQPNYGPQPGYGPPPPQQSGYPPQQGYPSQQGYPPQPGYSPQGYQPPPQDHMGGSPNPVVIVTNFGRNPQLATCPACRHHGVTRIDTESSIVTWGIAGGLCLLGCYPCAPIPFCVDDCKDAVHYCASCGNRLGKHSMLH